MNKNKTEGLDNSVKLISGIVGLLTILLAGAAWVGSIGFQSAEHDRQIREDRLLMDARYKEWRDWADKIEYEAGQIEAHLQIIARGRATKGGR